MAVITLRNIRAKLRQVIEKRAYKDGSSLNETVIRGLHHDLDHLAGTWSEEEAAAFEAALAEQRRVDPELWTSIVIPSAAEESGGGKA